MNTRRREFIAGLGGAAVWPLALRAQGRTLPVVGYLDGGSLDTSRETAAGVLRGLSEAEYFEGRNLAVEYRWAEDHYERLPALVNDLGATSSRPMIGFVCCCVSAASSQSTAPLSPARELSFDHLVGTHE